MGYQKLASRRRFLRNTASLIAAGGTASLVPQLSVLNSAMAADTSGYKALVCIDLNGGADNFNLLIPRNRIHYENYQKSRGGVYDSSLSPEGRAIDLERLVPINAPGGAGLTEGAYGVHPECADRPFDGGVTPGLGSLFDRRDLAFIANVGPLVQPMTRDEFDNPLTPRPPGIGGHNSQQIIWRTGRNDLRWSQGWGGMLTANAADGSASGSIALPPCIGFGNNLFQTARYPSDNQPLQPYTIGVNGTEPFRGYGGSLMRQEREILEEVLTHTYPDLMDAEAQRLVQSTYSINTQLAQLLGSDDSRSRVSTRYQSNGIFNPNINSYPPATMTVDNSVVSNGLLNALRQVARMIKLSRDESVGINASRQTYYITLPGHDTHFAQMEKLQPRSIAALSHAVGYFADAMREIGAHDDVTLFSMSEFGRTLSPNSGGTDHAWGSHHLVMGGAVDGGKIFGRYPDALLGANNNANQDWSFARGEYIPTTSVEQMAATLGRWFGSSESELDIIFPNLSNFTRDLGFMT